MNTIAEKSNYRIAAPRHFCGKCNRITATHENDCAQCGKELETVRRIRTTGAISLLLGIALLAVLGELALWVYHALTDHSPNAARFNGDASDFGFIVVVFGLVATISTLSVIAGLWQLIFGTRNKILKYIVLILGLAFIGMGLMLSVSKSV